MLQSIGLHIVEHDLVTEQQEGCLKFRQRKITSVENLEKLDALRTIVFAV